VCNSGWIRPEWSGGAIGRRHGFTMASSSSREKQIFKAGLAI
jgi:hypothetical protein